MRNIKDFLRQIRIEMKKILSSKVMLIFLVLVMLLSLAIPIISTLDLFKPRYYYGPYDEGELEVNGVVIEGDNMFYWEIMQAQDAINWINSNATDSTDDLALELVNDTLDDFVMLSQHISSYEDYRANIVWSRRQYMQSIFVLEHIDIPADEMMMVLEKTHMYYEDTARLKKEYYDLTDEERAEKLEESKSALELSDKIIIRGDHQAYFDYMKIEAETRLADNQREIERLEQSIVEDPHNEEVFNEQIENLQRSIAMHYEITIPILEYRIEHDIVPGMEDWRDIALRAKESALYSISYGNDTMTQEEFEEDPYMKREYETYKKYQEAMQKRIDDATNNLLIAERSLDSGKPDMQYVQEGTRKKVSMFLFYSLLIAVIGAVIGGGLISREIQTGTVRLLLIRPKSRTKIALSKLFALLIICFALYAVCIILNIISNGIVFGFSDLGYPNYTISAGVRGISFFAYLLPKILACSVVIIFSTCTAYFLSIVTKNTALSVSIPLIGFAGSLITMAIIGYSQKYKWLIYTPIPFVNMPSIVIGSYYSPSGIEPSVTYGVLLLLGLSVALVIAGTMIFKKRDVQN